MSVYAEIITSFERTGAFPLEANYIFSTLDELNDFYSDEVNKATLHEGLIKVVLDDGNGNQALYWAKKVDDEFVFVPLEGESSDIVWNEVE